MLSWLALGGNRSRLRQLEADTSRDKMALNDLLVKFNNLKNDAKAQIQSKDNEISKLKKGTALPSIITDAQDKEIKHWKAKAQALEERIDNSSNTGSSKKYKKIAEELDIALRKVEQRDQELDDLRTNLLSTDEHLDIEEELLQTIGKLKKRVKKYKKKLKALKALKAQKETIEIRETLDVDKLNRLLKEGKLTKTSKKVSTKKAKGKKQKDKKKKPSTSNS